MHAISSYPDNRPTNTYTHKHTHPQTHTHTNKQTHRQDRLQYTAPQLASAQRNKRILTIYHLLKQPVACLVTCDSPSSRDQSCPWVYFHRPNLTHQITDPTQPNPYPTEPLYIEQQLACRKKISLCTSCHHHHPNAHRNNANTHSITSITVILGLHATPNE